jgi:hypothetical protein
MYTPFLLIWGMHAMWNPVHHHRRREQEDQQQFPLSVHYFNKQGMRAMLKVNKQERETQN